jgi:hypothetical protein
VEKISFTISKNDADLKSDPLGQYREESDACGVGGQNVGGQHPANSHLHFPPSLREFHVMGTATDLPSLSNLSDPLDGLPPPYTEHDPQSAAQAPQYEIPSYTAQESTSTSATAKFPSAMNGYFQWNLQPHSTLGRPRTKSYTRYQPPRPFSITNPRSCYTMVQLTGTR